VVVRLVLRSIRHGCLLEFPPPFIAPLFRPRCGVSFSFDSAVWKPLWLCLCHCLSSYLPCWARGGGDGLSTAAAAATTAAAARCSTTPATASAATSSPDNRGRWPGTAAMIIHNATAARHHHDRFHHRSIVKDAQGSVGGQDGHGGGTTILLLGRAGRRSTRRRSHRPCTVPRGGASASWRSRRSALMAMFMDNLINQRINVLKPGRGGGRRRGCVGLCARMFARKKMETQEVNKARYGVSAWQKMEEGVNETPCMQSGTKNSALLSVSRPPWMGAYVVSCTC
jgi:hypothetical protein